MRTWRSGLRWNWFAKKEHLWHPTIAFYPISVNSWNVGNLFTILEICWYSENIPSKLHACRNFADIRKLFWRHFVMRCQNDQLQMFLHFRCPWEHRKWRKRRTSANRQPRQFCQTRQFRKHFEKLNKKQYAFQGFSAQVFEKQTNNNKATLVWLYVCLGFSGSTQDGNPWVMFSAGSWRPAHFL